MAKKGYEIGSGALTRAMLGEDAPKVDEKPGPALQSDKKSPPDIPFPETWKFYSQDDPECQHIFGRFGMLPLIPPDQHSVEPRDEIQLISIRVPGWKEAPETLGLECFATETLLLYKGSKLRLFVLRVYRFESRCDEGTMMDIDVQRPARPFIEKVDRRAPVLILASTPPEQYEQVTIAFAPGMNLLTDGALKWYKLRARKAVMRGGGDKRPAEIQALWTDDKCKEFAKLVKKLTPKWKWIKSNRYDPKFSTPQDWIAELRARSEFSGLFSKPDRPTDDLLLRVTDDGLSKSDREPQAIAYLHAARLLRIAKVYQNIKKPEPSIATLKSYYDKGLQLLRLSGDAI